MGAAPLPDLSAAPLPDLSAAPWPRGFGLLLAAQFASALADNALLIVAIALLQAQGQPAWWAPLLKFGFMLSYVLLAPWVGPLADALAKGRVMAWMNGVKVLGLLALLAGLHPVLALAVVGLGAAAYAPAKYGLITECVPAESLVAANAWIEVSVVCAALLGAVCGGALVSPAWLGWSGGLSGSLLALLGVYGLSAVLNCFVPDSGARRHGSSLQLRPLLRDFWAGNRRLWADPDGGLSLAATTLFWGVGATLQFAVLRWAGDVLRLTLDRAAYLQAAVAVGVIVGASAAGRWVRLAHAKHMLWAGVALGLLMPMVARVDEIVTAALLLALVGAVGGAMVVPLNALLQHRGHVLLSAGRSVAVQGFNENLSVLLMISAYTWSQALSVPITSTLSAMGLAVALAIALLITAERRRSTRRSRRERQAA